MDRTGQSETEQSRTDLNDMEQTETIQNEKKCEKEKREGKKIAAVSDSGGFLHIAKKGDTLYQLREQYHVSVAAMIYANPYLDVYHLREGDEVCIPLVKNAPAFLQRGAHHADV